MPGCAPARIPSGPKTTASTSGGPGRLVNTTSHCSAIAFGVVPHSAPALSCFAAASLRTSSTTSLYCDFCRLAAMKAPMVPRPMNPIFMLSALRLVLLVEHVDRDVRGGHRRRPAGIHGKMRDDLGGLVARQPVAEASADMAVELILPAERHQRRDRHQAAVALR